MSPTVPTTEQPEHPEPRRRPDLSEEQNDGTVLAMLICDQTCPMWSMEEITRTLGRIDAIDSVNRLAAAGLVHRIDQFVFPTLAARRADELEL